jgi:hypothetical protein
MRSGGQRTVGVRWRGHTDRPHALHADHHVALLPTLFGRPKTNVCSVSAVEEQRNTAGMPSPLDALFRP